MNKLIILVLFYISLTNLAAQPATVNEEKMKIFSAWVGRWHGEGTMQMGPGESRKSKVDENVEYRLGGNVLLLEGVGTAYNSTTKEETVVHHAFAVLSYDQNNNNYKFNTHLKDGRGGDGWFNVTAANNYQWGFDSPRGKIRYTITLDPAKKAWHETGEILMNNSWIKFFEMNLTKTE